MRVIAGDCKGRPLKAVPGMGTRPTTDKIKESIFNMIGPFFDGGQGLDLYGGSGGLGIEALSRGMDHFIFIDKDQKALQTIKENLKQCKYEEKAEIFRNDAKRALKALHKRELQFDMIFLDPPYAKQMLLKDIEEIGKLNLLADSGSIVAEHGSEVTLPEKIGDFELIRQETYGKTTTISIYKRN
ncbi:16S rRNA (guanine(966)-N(2))-methyltransferase RsmD [Fictibacillus barbaricus]|uniref:16S rRNA (Guanine(966)-N(2))-methyltransferase RsmD n=1 Tax=Fictibacillus barbaricus TaxID=182136 RepID=A0ABU1TY56_9BACL|nr:16S rRNA (guanine(966)-N(2))-methyltransferase RsmD [Fictibacillus barbaricus]MDR7072129.1 16S rRNA (guanine(966)-N(2))-methyltransferase RsmD [Fictibacillus barbaricus]